MSFECQRHEDTIYSGCTGCLQGQLEEKARLLESMTEERDTLRAIIDHIHYCPSPDHVSPGAVECTKYDRAMELLAHSMAARASLDLQVARLTEQTRNEAIAYSTLAKSYEDMKLQVRDLWDLLLSIPSGPGEGMVSTPEDARCDIEWGNKYRAVIAKYKPDQVIENRVESCESPECGNCGGDLVQKTEPAWICPKCEL